MISSKRPVGLALVAAALLVAPAALAAGGKDESVKGDRGGGVSGGGAGPGGGGSAGAVEQPNVERDQSPLFKRPDKKWEVGAGFEAHRLFIQNDLQGLASDKFFNYYSAHVSVSPTKNDLIGLYFGAYQRFIADPNESGFRLDDLYLRYVHYFPLPAQTELRLGGTLYAPTSFASQKAGTIGAGRLSVGFQKIWGKYLLTDIRSNLTGYWQQYNTPSQADSAIGGGNPNPLAALSVAAEVEVKMPFHTPLSVGIEGYTGYTWYLSATGQLPPGSPGAVSDQTFGTGQPMQQSYGGEVFVGYKFPEVYGLKTDLHIAVAEGDPALGYNSALHDGISHAYIYWRESSEVYASLTARY